MIAGVLTQSDGRILFQGRSVIKDLPEFQRRIGYVPEEPNLCPGRCPAPAVCTPDTSRPKRLQTSSRRECGVTSTSQAS